MVKILIKKNLISLKILKKLNLKIFGEIMVCLQQCGYLIILIKFLFLKNILTISSYRQKPIQYFKKSLKTDILNILKENLNSKIKYNHLLRIALK